MLTEKDSTIQILANKFNSGKRCFYFFRCLGPAIFVLYLFFYSTNLFNSIVNKPVPYWIDPVGWAELTAASGFAGLLFSWLLNWLHETECGVEMNEIFSYKYKTYITNILFFLASTSICIYYSRTAASSTIGVLAVVIANSISMAAELFYIGSMCWGFLFSMKNRKRNTYLYLQSKVMSEWSSAEYLEWNTAETAHVIGEFSYCINWASYNQSQWFFHMWSIRFQKLMQSGGNTVPQMAQGTALTQWVRETKDMLDAVFCSNPDDMAKEILGSLLYAFALDYNIIGAYNDYLTNNVVNVYQVGYISEKYCRISYISQLTIWALRLFNRECKDGDEHRIDDVFWLFYMAVRHAHMLLRNLDGKKKDGIKCTIDFRKFRTLSQTAMFTCAAALYIEQGDARQEDFSLKCAVKRYNDYLNDTVFSGWSEGADCESPFSSDLFAHINRIVSKYNRRPISLRENPEVTEAFQIVMGWFVPPKKPDPPGSIDGSSSAEERRSETYV